MLSALSALPLAVFAIWMIVHNAEHDRHRILARIQQTTRALIQTIDERFESRIALLQGLATSSGLREGRLDHFDQRAREALRGATKGTYIIVSDRTGQQVVNTSVPFGTALPQRVETESVEKVFATERPWISNVFVGALSKQLTVSVDVPVFGYDGAVKYGLAMTIPL